MCLTGCVVFALFVLRKRNTAVTAEGFKAGCALYLVIWSGGLFVGGQPSRYDGEQARVAENNARLDNVSKWPSARPPFKSNPGRPSIQRSCRYHHTSPRSPTPRIRNIFHNCGHEIIFILDLLKGIGCPLFWPTSRARPIPLGARARARHCPWIRKSRPGGACCRNWRAVVIGTVAGGHEYVATQWRLPCSRPSYRVVDPAAGRTIKAIREAIEQASRGAVRIVSNRPQRRRAGVDRGHLRRWKAL